MVFFVVARMHLNVTFSFQDILNKIKRDNLRIILKKKITLPRLKDDYIKKVKESIKDLPLRAQLELLGPYMTVKGAYVLIMLKNFTFNKVCWSCKQHLLVFRCS